MKIKARPALIAGLVVSVVGIGSMARAATQTVIAGSGYPIGYDYGCVDENGGRLSNSLLFCGHTLTVNIPLANDSNSSTVAFTVVANGSDASGSPANPTSCTPFWVDSSSAIHFGTSASTPANTSVSVLSLSLTGVTTGAGIGVKCTLGAVNNIQGGRVSSINYTL